MELTQEQHEAATASASRVSVIAGPGTGKTSTIVARAVHLIENLFTDEDDILIVTFTRKAAKEVQDRIREAGHNVRCGTFHSIALEGMTWSPQVISDDEALAVVEKIIPLYSDMRPARALAEINRRRLAGDRDELTVCYESTLSVYGQIDYTALMLEFKAQTESPGSKLRSYQHIIVDEAQDTDEFQFDCIVKLQDSGANLFSVGDANQCIYSWRGATIDRFEGGERFGLTLDFRNPPDVVCAANAIAKKISEATLRPESLVTATSFANGLSFATDPVDSVMALLADAFQPEDIAVLARTNHTVARITGQLSIQGIQAKDVCPDRPLLKFMRAIANPSWCQIPDSLAIFGPGWLTESDAVVRTELCQHWLDNLGDKTVSSVLASFEFHESLKEEVFWWNNYYGFFNVQDAVNEVTLSRQEDISGSGVSVLTVHQCKGLEFPAVVVVAEPLLWPLTDEELRIFYVAITRAESRCVIVETDGPTKITEIVRNACAS